MTASSLYGPLTIKVHDRLGSSAARGGAGDRDMTMAGISQLSAPTANQLVSQALNTHKHGHRSRSTSDIDAMGSSPASSPSATGTVGSKLDVTA
jgi:hypothetical protein